MDTIDPPAQPLGEGVMVAMVLRKHRRFPAKPAGSVALSDRQQTAQQNVVAED